MNTELEVLKDVLQRLNQSHLPYMLTGSMAKIYYSTPRMTRDIDIVIQLLPKDATKLIQIFSPDYYIEPESVTEAIQSRGMFNILHNTKIVKIDFVVKKNTAFRDTEFERKKRINLAGLDIWIVSPEDLILSKLDWAKESYSEMQLGDIADLFKSQNSLDMRYIEEWVNKLGLEEIFRSAKKKMGSAK